MRSFFLALAIVGIQAATCPYTAVPTEYMNLGSECAVLTNSGLTTPVMHTD